MTILTKTPKRGLIKAAEAMNGVLPFDAINTVPETPEKQPRQTKISGPRDHKAEAQAAKHKFAQAAADLRLAREDDSLGDDVFKIAQTMILCTLPYRPTEGERQITKKARLSDGSMLSVTFTAGREDVPLPYGADRKLLTWMIDRCIQSDVPLIEWHTATEYMRDIGLTDAGNNLRELKQRFRRLAGLLITIERRSLASERGKMLAFIEEWNLPHSVDLEAEKAGQDRLPAVREHYGFLMNEKLFQEVKKNHVVIPRRFWLRTRNIGSQMQDYILWLLYRCYCAQSETFIPWDKLRDQLWQADKKINRIKMRFTKAVRFLKAIWPEVNVQVLAEGLLIGPSTKPLLPDDPGKNRVRRLVKH